MMKSTSSSQALTAAGIGSWVLSAVTLKEPAIWYSSPVLTIADPKFSWFTTVGPTAIAFLNSARLGVDYRNDVFVGDINNGNLYHFPVNATRDGFDLITPGLADLVADNSTELQEVILGTGFGGITDLKIGPDGLLYILSFGLGKIFVVSGQSTRVDFSVDFDDDAKSDIAVYRDGTWFILCSSDGGVSETNWGGAPQDIPVPGTMMGTGRRMKRCTEMACGGSCVHPMKAGSE